MSRVAETLEESSILLREQLRSICPHKIDRDTVTKATEVDQIMTTEELADDSKYSRTTVSTWTASIGPRRVDVAASSMLQPHGCM
ncbi:hypothetical protein KIN20_014413 [Parelaphostrongylus tenuis]|uniref:Uncharacterized protein n=1 Tax=Parelaphostrongylus tenuis TaxID=148309 RepID=A0AAD5MZI5_PARTN|nr:hypothetical protein KIN20_014413 [Parelaphostrongylus tenuis]